MNPNLHHLVSTAISLAPFPLCLPAPLVYCDAYSNHHMILSINATEKQRFFKNLTLIPLSHPRN